MVANFVRSIRPRHTCSKRYLSILREYTVRRVYLRMKIWVMNTCIQVSRQHLPFAIFPLPSPTTGYACPCCSQLFQICCHAELEYALWATANNGQRRPLLESCFAQLRAVYSVYFLGSGVKDHRSASFTFPPARSNESRTRRSTLA